MRRSTLFILFIVLFLTHGLMGQIGGSSVYEFLNITTPARIAATGGDFHPARDNDINLVLSNPSIIDKNIHNHISLNFVDYFAGINAGYFTYSRSYDKIGSFTVFSQFVDYGQFVATESTGLETGTFKAGEYAGGIGWGRRLDSSFSVGANLKFISSSLEMYNSTGMAVDIAASYHNSDELFDAVLIVKNIGRQLSAYNYQREPLPFEIQMGISKRLKHVPFRFSLLYNNIEKYRLVYNGSSDDAPVDLITGESKEENKVDAFADNLMRHFVIGGEFTIAKNLCLRIGYNYKRRQELKVPTKISMVGFSWGFGVRISKFSFNYGRAAYHLAGAPNNISISTNFSDIIKKSK